MRYQEQDVDNDTGLAVDAMSDTRFGQMPRKNILKQRRSSAIAQVTHLMRIKGADGRLTGTHDPYECRRSD